MKDRINILGAGLVGTLLSTLMAKKAFTVNVFEKRADPRISMVDEGRSINLALSHRGIRALRMTGAYDTIRNELIPMKGRMIHDLKGGCSFQPYGKEGQHINSVSRAGLNKALITIAEEAGAHFHFDHKCEKVDLRTATAYFDRSGGVVSHTADVLIGADGAYSALRRSFQELDTFSFEEQYIDHGYKELTIAPQGGDFALEPNYLHIWPRGSFMMIALPNPDKSFTCTLFFPFQGSLSFASLDTDEKITDFFERYFPDLIVLIPDFQNQFRSNPTSSLVTVRAAPWHAGNCLLIGDACHAIVPFYGQGMNAGFEDCRLFVEWGENLAFRWDKLLPFFSENRKKDADAIAELALKNFVEMRDKVADRRFLDIKKVEARLQKTYPAAWTPLYSMVTFSDIPYHKALLLGKLQERIMNELPEGFDPETVDLGPLIAKFNDLKPDDL